MPKELRRNLAEKEEDTVEGNTVPGRNEEKADSAVSGRNEDKADSAVAGEADPDAKTGQNLLTVHVCGAVKNEGVYSLPAGSRIFDAVKAAGGFSDNADRSYLNLAMEVEDAWQIRIPSKEETEALRRQREVPEQDGSTGSAEDGKDIYGKLTGPDTPFIVKGPAPDGREGRGYNRGCCIRTEQRSGRCEDQPQYSFQRGTDENTRRRREKGAAHHRLS